VANLLLDILRSLATGAIADKVKEDVVPEAKRMYDEYTREPQRAQTEGARMIDGYPSMSSGLPAETAPYNRKGMEPVAPETLQEMLRMGAAAKQNIAGQAYEPVPADGMSAEEEARFAERLNATPSQPIDYTDMDQRLEGQFRQNELDRTIAAENRGNVLDFVRQAGEGMGTAETSPYTPSGDSSAMFKPLSQRVQEKAVEIKSTTPEIQSDTQVTAAASQDVAKELEAEIGEKERLGMNADSEKSMLSQLMDGAMSFFGDRNTWMALGAAANELRFKPSDAYRKAMFETADKERELERMNKSLPALNKLSPDLAAAVKAGVLSVKEALTIAYKNPSKIQEVIRLMKDDPETFKMLKDAGVLSSGTNVTIGGEGSKGWQKIDEKFADTFLEWRGGGAASAAKNIGTLKSVASDLASGADLTGVFQGLVPEGAKSIFTPEAKNARDKVASVVQLSMKEILGAQFTEKEGAQLIKRSYDEGLSEEQNLARLNAMIMQLEAAQNAKQQMVDHFIAKGTLAGMERIPMPTAQDFSDAMDAAAPRVTPVKEGEEIAAPSATSLQVGNIVDGHEYLGGNPAEKSSWKKVQ
jgi:hypothetical protein